MPFTINGCGTRYYGKREQAADGSYIATEWITFIYVPLIPIRSYRVLPVGQGKNIIVHSSQRYQTMRAPLCWAHIRNVYLVLIPIVLLVIYFNWSDIDKWLKDDVLRSGPRQLQVQVEKLQAQPVAADLPLSAKDAEIACGKVLKLNKAAFERLNLVDRLAAVVANSGFTEKELKELGPDDDLNKESFSAYSFAYLTWDKPTDVPRARMDQMVVDAVHSVDTKKLTADQIAALDSYFVRYKSMMLKAFELGRHDAKASPCPY
jgi:hypothetical protein